MKLRMIQRLESSEGGFALAAVIFVLALLGVLAVTSFVTTGDERRASVGMRESARAFYAAEAGVNLVMARWDSVRYDTLIAGPGDSLDLGWETLPENGCSFRVVLLRVDDGSGTPAYHANVWGRGVGGLAERNLAVVLTSAAGASLLPGITLGGDGEISGSPTITGPCAGIHSNGEITKGAKNLTLDGEYTAVGPIDQGGYLDSDGNPHTPTSGADPVPIPPLDPLDYCPADADYILRNGYIVTVSPLDSAVVGSAGDTWGWKIEAAGGANTKYELGKGGNPEDGTLCVFGNVELSGGAGSDGAPLDMSIIATGNIQLTGTSFIAGNTDGIALLAGGDLWLTGSAGVSSDNFAGLIYANGECEMSGSASIKGSIVCAGNPLPPFSSDITPAGNEFSGSFSIEFDCTSPLSGGGGITISSGSWTDLSY